MLEKSQPFVYEPLSAENLADPYPAYAALRDLPGLYWHEGMQSYVAARYSTCKYVLSANAQFAKDRRRIGVDIPEQFRSVQTEDPPNRLGLRQEFRHALNVTDLSELCRQVGDRFEERLRGAGTSFDFVSDVAYPTALDLTATVVGLSHEQAENYFTCHRDLQRGTDSGLDPSRYEPAIKASARLQQYAAEWIEQESIEALLAPAKDFALRYPKDYTTRTLAGMVNASFSTAASFTAGIFNLMVSNPALAESARSAVTNGSGYRAVSEFLRFLSPAQATSRLVVTDCRLDGVDLKRGDTVVTLMAAANRDPELFSNPDSLDLDRSNNRHLAFAAGPHLCLGKKLAEEWGIELLRRLTVDDTCAHLQTSPGKYLDSATVRSMVSLPTVRV